jgi:2-keto-3-deoxy-L-rhamnonate aldolase RhmA
MTGAGLAKVGNEVPEGVHHGMQRREKMGKMGTVLCTEDEKGRNARRWGSRAIVTKKSLT